LENIVIYFTCRWLQPTDQENPEVRALAQIVRTKVPMYDINMPLAKANGN